MTTSDAPTSDAPEGGASKSGGAPMGDGVSTRGGAPTSGGDLESGVATTSGVSVGRRRVWMLWMVAAVAYAIDLGAKLLVVAGLEGRTPIPVIGDWMELRVQRNPGAAFGFGAATTIVFTFVAVAVVVAIVRVSRRLTSTPWAVALGLLLGGALGNLTDRLFRSPGGLQGAVVDFIAVRDFSVMNLADWALTCGCAMVLLLSFRGRELSPASTSSG